MARLRPFHGFCVATLGIAAASAAIPAPEGRGRKPAVTVVARAATVAVGTTSKDTANDPAIWRDDADPAKQVIVGTDR